ncbi:MAG: serine/threonine-protein kinase PknK [Spirochaetota bacterium]
MLQIDGFDIHEKLNTDNFIKIYRATRKIDRKKVVLKCVREDYGSSQYLKSIQKEYDILKRLRENSIISCYDFIRNKEESILVLEDGGINLKQHIADNGRIDIITFLNFSIAMAGIIAVIHKNRIIHKDVKPSNFVIHKNGTIKLIDFGISTQLNKEETGWKSLNVLEGSLPYISPEQTGRVNRLVDHRSDFYSLGITFYEILTGDVPFTAKDPLELVYCHMTQTPTKISQIRSDIPLMVSLLIEKLTEKDADKRYRSAVGLQRDLQKCFLGIQTQGRVEEFLPGERDFSDKLQLSQKLYGREKETIELLKTFEKVVQGNSEILFVTGYSGIGKSAFINETHKALTEKNGFFIKGKFEQFQRNIPFSAIVQAFRRLIDHLLTETEESLLNWKNKLEKVLGVNAQVIIDVIPELELVIGPQKSVPHLGPTENQNRFRIAFKSFISVFTQKEHPIILFIDDLQWADVPSLNFLHLLITDITSNHLLIIGAYRDNEVTPMHPLYTMIGEIEKQGKTIKNISIKPLSITDISMFLTDSFPISANHQLEYFAKLLLRKTAGNPFFLAEFLKALYRENLVYFDYGINKWVWDEDKIQSYGITENVVSLMLDNLQKLPQTTLEQVSLAACLGNQISVGILSIISQIPILDVVRCLWPAIEAEMLIPIGKAQMLLQIAKENGTIFIEELKSMQVRFQHDRVQHAAYSLLEVNKRKKIHLDIARLLFSNTQENKKEDNLFEVVGHFNQSLELLEETTEKVELVKLNLQAGIKAKLSTAYETAVNYLEIGKSLLT